MKNVEGTYVVEPTPLILVGINVELDSHVLAILNIKLTYAVFTEHTEQHASRILAWDLQHIVLRHP